MMELYHKVHSFYESTVCIQILMFFILQFDSIYATEFHDLWHAHQKTICYTKKYWLQIKVQVVNIAKLYALNSSQDIRSYIRN